MSQFNVYRYNITKIASEKEKYLDLPIYRIYIFIIYDICLCLPSSNDESSLMTSAQDLHSRLCLIVDLTQCVLVGLHLSSFPALLRMLKSNVRVPLKLPARRALVWRIFLRSRRVLAHLCDLGSF